MVALIGCCFGEVSLILPQVKVLFWGKLSFTCHLAGGYAFGDGVHGRAGEAQRVVGRKGDDRGGVANDDHAVGVFVQAALVVHRQRVREAGVEDARDGAAGMDEAQLVVSRQRIAADHEDDWRASNSVGKAEDAPDLLVAVCLGGRLDEHSEMLVLQWAMVTRWARHCLFGGPLLPA